MWTIPGKFSLAYEYVLVLVLVRLVDFKSSIELYSVQYQTQLIAHLFQKYKFNMAAPSKSNDGPSAAKLVSNWDRTLWLSERKKHPIDISSQVTIYDLSRDSRKGRKACDDSFLSLISCNPVTIFLNFSFLKHYRDISFCNWFSI